MKYTIFRTQWGYFGLAANISGLLRSVLPCPDRKTTRRYLLAGLKNAHFEKNLLKSLQGRIVAYFKGKPVKFGTPVCLDHLAPFTRKVLTACRRISPGKTASYSQLARMAGRPRASRAVGNALAKNPIPLVIPCHRVIRSDGSIGNFSAFGRAGSGSPARGGKALKYKLLRLERAV